MEITYLGHSCFKIKGKDNTILIDPYDETIGKLSKQSCDILINSHQHGDHNHNEIVSDYKILIDVPGEYEIGGTFIYGYPTFHDNKLGEERGKNTIFSIEVEGYVVMHLGDLGHQLDQKFLEKIEDVDVLMVPVGGFYTIDAKTASKVIAQIEPKIVIPMHFKKKDDKSDSQIDTLEKFMEEMGLEEVKEEDKLNLSSRTNLPEETQVVILKA